MKLQVPKRHLRPNAQYHTMKCMVLGSGLANDLHQSPCGAVGTPPQAPCADSYNETAGPKAAPRAACRDSYHEMHCVGPTCDLHRAPAGPLGLSPMALTPTPPPLLGRWDSASSPLVQNHTLKLQVPKRHFGPPPQHHNMKGILLGPPGTCTAAPAEPLVPWP